ncbi:MAG TPA: HAMP domain-containing sensor histidine kinase [Phycisphaeraceae bacterium]
MADRVRISLANKCLLLFGAAVVLILSAALAVVWQRMQKQVDQVPRQRAASLAQAWLSGQMQPGQAQTPPEQAVRGLLPQQELTLAWIEGDALQSLASQEELLAQALERFEARPDSQDWFIQAVDEQGERYYRYLRAVRRSDLPSIHPNGDGADAPDQAQVLDNPLRAILLVQLRNPEGVAQQIVNRIYIVTAGIFAGLLAIAVFWFIATRLILSPVRLLREVAAKASEGDLSVRSDINTGDEFEELSKVFNTMLENLKEKQDQLRSINKSLDLKLGELAASNVALYEANKVKGEFLANVSHELRTPLNSIIGFAEILQEMPPQQADTVDEKRRRYLANIIQSSRRLLDLINDLLDLAKIEAGRMDVHLGAISVSDTCEGLINLIRPLAQKRQITLRLKVEPSLPIVHSDAGKLQQILFNFLSNAVKFTPAGGVVTLGATLMPPEKPNGTPRVRLSVSDTGPGIAAEDHERIFEKFTQLDPSVTKEHGGTGLGLTISRELAQLLQGSIELDSDVGKGATFSLIIPVTLEQRVAPLMPETSSARQAAASG